MSTTDNRVVSTVFSYFLSVFVRFLRPRYLKIARSDGFESQEFRAHFGSELRPRAEKLEDRLGLDFSST